MDDMSILVKVMESYHLTDIMGAGIAGYIINAVRKLMARMEAFETRLIQIEMKLKVIEDGNLKDKLDSIERMIEKRMDDIKQNANLSK